MTGSFVIGELPKPGRSESEQPAVVAPALRLRCQSRLSVTPALRITADRSCIARRPERSGADQGERPHELPYTPLSLSPSDTDRRVAPIDKVDLAAKLASFDELWRPKIVARLNDYDVQLVKVKGEFVWHKHDDTDDFFLVLKGHLTIQLRDQDVDLREGELFIVPRGIEHCPRADEEAQILLIEPAGTANTGDTGGPRTAEKHEI